MVQLAEMLNPAAGSVEGGGTEGQPKPGDIVNGEVVLEKPKRKRRWRKKPEGWVDEPKKKKPPAIKGAVPGTSVIVVNGEDDVNGDISVNDLNFNDNTTSSNGNSNNITASSSSTNKWSEDDAMVGVYVYLLTDPRRRPAKVFGNRRGHALVEYVGGRNEAKSWIPVPSLVIIDPEQGAKIAEFEREQKLLHGAPLGQSSSSNGLVGAGDENDLTVSRGHRRQRMSMTFDIQSPNTQSERSEKQQGGRVEGGGGVDNSSETAPEYPGSRKRRSLSRDNGSNENIASSPSEPGRMSPRLNSHTKPHTRNDPLWPQNQQFCMDPDTLPKVQDAIMKQNELNKTFQMNEEIFSSWYGPCGENLELLSRNKPSSSSNKSVSKVGDVEGRRPLHRICLPLWKPPSKSHKVEVESLLGNMVDKVETMVEKNQTYQEVDDEKNCLDTLDSCDASSSSSTSSSSSDQNDPISYWLLNFFDPYEVGLESDEDSSKKTKNDDEGNDISKKSPSSSSSNPPSSPLRSSSRLVSNNTSKQTEESKKPIVKKLPPRALPRAYEEAALAAVGIIRRLEDAKKKKKHSVQDIVTENKNDDKDGVTDDTLINDANKEGDQPLANDHENIVKDHESKEDLKEGENLMILDTPTEALPTDPTASSSSSSSTTSTSSSLTIVMSSSNVSTTLTTATEITKEDITTTLPPVSSTGSLSSSSMLQTGKDFPENLIQTELSLQALVEMPDDWTITTTDSSKELIKIHSAPVELLEKKQSSSAYVDLKNDEKTTTPSSSESAEVSENDEECSIAEVLERAGLLLRTCAALLGLDLRTPPSMQLMKKWGGGPNGRGGGPRGVFGGSRAACRRGAGVGGGSKNLRRVRAGSVATPLFSHPDGCRAAAPLFGYIGHFNGAPGSVLDGWYGNSEVSQLTQDALLSASTRDVRTLVEVRKQTIVINDQQVNKTNDSTSTSSTSTSTSSTSTCQVSGNNVRYPHDAMFWSVQLDIPRLIFCEVLTILIDFCWSSPHPTWLLKSILKDNDKIDDTLDQKSKKREVWTPSNVLLHHRYHHSNDDNDDEGDRDKEDKIHPPVLSFSSPLSVLQFFRHCFIATSKLKISHSALMRISADRIIYASRITTINEAKSKSSSDNIHGLANASTGNSGGGMASLEGGGLSGGLIYACENCTRPHDGMYGSGRFCSVACRSRFNGRSRKPQVIPTSTPWTWSVDGASSLQSAVMSLGPPPL
jgi:hypothetical protein